MTGSVEKIYAQALYELGVENNSLEELYREISEVDSVFEANPELIKFYSAPTIPGEEKLQFTKQLFEKQVSELTYHFLCVLTEKQRIPFLGKIKGELKEKFYEHQGILEITAVTSVPLSERLKNKLLEKLAGVTGKTVYLLERVDPAILGGIVLHYGSTQMDASVRSRLDALQAQVKSLIA